MANERVRVGIIGAGWAGRAHARFYKRVPFVDMVGWADMVPGKAAEAAAEAGLPPSGVFEDYHQMLQQLELDAVSICTFNMGHRQPTIDALAAGKHILLEKPMAANLEDAKAIMRAWEQHRDRILMVGFQPDFSAEHQAARQIVDTGVYAIHTALWLMGDPKPVSVSAITGNPLIKGVKGVRQTFAGPWSAAEVDVEEFAFAFVRFENDAALTVKSTWAANADTIGRPFFLGTRAGLALRPIEVFVNQQYGELNMTSTPAGLPSADADWEASWTAKMRNFAEAVRDGKPSPIDPRGVFLVNVVMDGILRSAAAGHEVKVSAEY